MGELILPDYYWTISPVNDLIDVTFHHIKSGLTNVIRSIVKVKVHKLEWKLIKIPLHYSCIIFILQQIAQLNSNNNCS